MPLRLVVCIPGREFSGRFLDSYTSLLSGLQRAGIQYAIVRAYDPVVYNARNRVLGGDLRRGPKQRPWNGDLQYDFMLWIDSDMVFAFEDFVHLLEHDVTAVSGLYLLADGRRYAAVETMREEDLLEGGSFHFLTPEERAQKKGLFAVDYAGLGFCLFKRGVFERLEYPWFRPLEVCVGDVRDFTSEDVALALLLREQGVRLQVDPAVVLGHEKPIVLR